MEAIYAEIGQAFGRVPNVFKAYAAHYPMLHAKWNAVNNLLMNGVLPRKVKEAIAVLVSADNSCQYCVLAHQTALRQLGMGAKQITLLETSLSEAGFSPKEEALINFARQANLSQGPLPAGSRQRLKELGASQEEMLEALGIMEIFVGFNKVIHALEVEVDF